MAGHFDPKQGGVTEEAAEVANLVSLLRAREPSVVLEALRALKGMAATAEGCGVLLAHQYLVKSLIPHLAAPSTSGSGSTCGSTRGRGSISISTTNAAVAAAILCRLAQWDDGWRAILQQPQAVPALAACLEHASTAAVCNALVALDYLARGYVGRRAIKRVGVGRLVRCMGHAEPGTQQRALSALTTLTEASFWEAVRRADQACGAQEPQAASLLVARLGSSNDETARLAADLVHALVECGCPSINVLGRAGAVAALLSCLQRANMRVVSAAAQALSSMAWASQHVRTTVERSGSLPWLVELAAGGDDAAAFCALLVLRAVAMRPTGRAAVGQVPGIMAALVKCTGSAALVRVTMALLRDLMQSEDGLREAGDEIGAVVRRGRELGSLEQATRNLQQAVIMAAGSLAGSKRAA